MSWQAIALMSDKIVHVAVGVILRCLDDDVIPKVYLTRRAANVHQGGKWEFPGGKRESNETIEQALTRELSEEIGIAVTKQSQFMLIEHIAGQLEDVQESLNEMMNNGVNIKRLQEDVKILREDVEKLKDSNRDIIYKNGKTE
mgnify:CR=1 FL=1